MNESEAIHFGGQAARPMQGQALGLGGAAYRGDQVNTAPSGELAQAVKALDMQIAELEQLIGQHEKQLTPYLRAARPEATGPGQNKMDTSAPIVEMVRRTTERITNLRDNLRGIASRVVS